MLIGKIPLRGIMDNIGRFDPYKVLGIARGASKDAIKKAYLEKIKKYHPDYNKELNSKEKFIKVQNAYNMLIKGKGPKDDFKEAQGNYNDIYTNIMKNFGRFKEYMSDLGNIQQKEIEISFLESVHGVSKNISYIEMGKCPKCKGYGGNNRKKILTCQTCQGTGTILEKNSSGITGHICYRCRGAGEINSDPCNYCKGSKYIKEKKNISITIPSGILNGEVIIIESLNTKIYLRIRVKGDKKYIQDGLNIHQIIKIPFSIAIIGGEIEIDGLYGRQKLNIKENTRSGEIYRISGGGIRRKCLKGDHLIHIELDLPDKITTEQKKVIEENFSIEKEAVKNGNIFKYMFGFGKNK